MFMRDEEVRSEQPIDEGPDVQEALLADAQSQDSLVTERPEPTEPAPPITSRFLFVNVAGQRARQLRRGAIARLEPDDIERLSSSKAERVAMEEVRQRLVYWEMPEWHPVRAFEVEPPRKRRRSRKQREEDAA